MDEILKNKKLREEGKFIGIPMWEVFPKLEKNLPSLPRGSNVMISAASGMGKALANSELVLTPNGWVKNESLKINDFVIGSDGKAKQILQIYPQGLNDIYEVSFQDGTKVKCDLNHIWTVYSYSRYNKPMNKTVKELLKVKLVKERYDERYGTIQYKYHYCIKLSEPIEFTNSRKLPLDPYTLGVLIGDGSLTQFTPDVTLNKKLNINSLILPEGMVYTIYKEERHCIRYGLSYKKGYENPLGKILKELGLFGCKSVDKFIPELYLKASIKDRKALLQGLLDTDGYTTKDRPNFNEYSTSSKQLKDDIIELVKSLGIYVRSTKRIPTYNGKSGEKLQGNCSYRIYINFNKKYKFITSIKKLEYKEYTTCISIESEDNLYITNGYNLTHNSKLFRFLLKSVYSIYKKYKNKGLNIGLKPKFLIFLTEESKTDFIHFMRVALVRDKLGYSISKSELLSLTKVPLSNEKLKDVQSVESELQELLSFMVIIDSISNPYGIYKYCRYFSNERGIHYYTKFKEKSEPISYDTWSKLDKEEKENYRYSHYTQHDPEEYVIVGVDNLNNLAPEEKHKGDLRLAMVNFSRDYVVKQMIMHWKWTVIQVIQQAMDTEKKQFTFKGDSILEKLKPSIAGLGDAKTVARDTQVFIGLFKPAKYGFEEYEGYNTSKEYFGESFISLIFEKNRLGPSSFELPVYFNGASEMFRELSNPIESNKAIKEYKNNKLNKK